MSGDQDALFEIFTCQTSGFFKYPIEFATKGRQTHAYITVGPNLLNLKPGTYSMEPGGLVWRDFDYWQPASKNNPHSRFELDKHQQVNLCKFIIAHKDARYDWFGDGVVGLNDVSPCFTDPAWHLFEAAEVRVFPNWWFCSAFADAAFTSVGETVIRGRSKLTAKAVTPMDLTRDWVARGWANPIFEKGHYEY